MTIEHSSLVFLAKSFGLVYMMCFFLIIIVYTYWPSNRKRYDAAAKSVINEDDLPCQ